MTLVDLSGITRVSVDRQQYDVYTQISNIFMDYITSKHSLILNVMSETVDFSKCESTKMCHPVGPLGERTLTVVTK